MSYSSPAEPAGARPCAHHGEGWENSRRRDGGDDHVAVRLPARGSVRRVEIDTSYFIGNAAGWAALRAA